MKTYVQIPIWVAPVVSFIITFLLILVANTLHVPPVAFGIGGLLCFLVLTILLYRLSNGSRSKRLQIEYLSNEKTEKTPEVGVTTTSIHSTVSVTDPHTHTYQDGITRNDFGIPLGENTTQTTHHSFPQPLSFYTGTPPYCSEGLGEDFT